MIATETRSIPRRGNGNKGMLPPVETKREKFVRLSESRTKNVIKSFRVLRKLGSNASAYEFDGNDVDDIIGTLQKEVDELKAKMVPPGVQEEIEFMLRRR